MIDVDRLRSDTPGTRHVVHLNNAGAALMPRQVIDAMTAYLDHEINHGGYETRDACADQIEASYGALAEVIGGTPSEISFEDNATRAWDMAFYGLGLGAGDRIVTTSTEYQSNLGAYFHVRDRHGVVIEVVPDTPDGDIDLDALARMVTGAALITMNHIPTNSGVVLPAATVGAIARNHGVPFLLDACQSVGQVPIDVDDIGCDMLSATSRKYLRGPRGVGFLWVRSEFIGHLHPPFVELESGVVDATGYQLHDDRRRFETWEKNYAGVVGMGAAARYALALGIDALWERIRTLAAFARNELATIDGLTVRDRGTTLGGLVTFDVASLDAFAIRDRLRAEGINVSVATSGSSPIDMEARGLDAVVRASVHAYNTEDEVIALIESIRQM